MLQKASPVECTSWAQPLWGVELKNIQILNKPGWKSYFFEVISPTHSHHKPSHGDGSGCLGFWSYSHSKGFWIVSPVGLPQRVGKNQTFVSVDQNPWIKIHFLRHIKKDQKVIFPCDTGWGRDTNVNIRNMGVHQVRASLLICKNSPCCPGKMNSRSPWQGKRKNVKEMLRYSQGNSLLKHKVVLPVFLLLQLGVLKWFPSTSCNWKMCFL